MMKLIPVAALFALCLTGAALAQVRPAALMPWTPPEADFSVSFAATPHVQTRPAERSKDIGLRRYSDAQGGEAFVVSIDAYPPDILPHSADSGVYDHMLRAHAEDSETQLVSTRPARLSGRPCLEGTFADKDDNGEIVRILVVGDVIWKLTWAHVADISDRAAADAFFASFKLAAH